MYVQYGEDNTYRKNKIEAIVDLDEILKGKTLTLHSSIGITLSSNGKSRYGIVFCIRAGHCIIISYSIKESIR